MTNAIPIAPAAAEENFRPLGRAAALAALPILQKEAEEIAQAAERLTVRSRLYQAKVDACLEAILRSEP